MITYMVVVLYKQAYKWVCVLEIDLLNFYFKNFLIHRNMGRYMIFFNTLANLVFVFNGLCIAANPTCDSSDTKPMEMITGARKKDSVTMSVNDFLKSSSLESLTLEDESNRTINDLPEKQVTKPLTWFQWFLSFFIRIDEKPEKEN